MGIREQVYTLFGFVNVIQGKTLIPWFRVKRRRPSSAQPACERGKSFAYRTNPLKDKDKLPPDFEERMGKSIDDAMKTFPWDEMLQAMVPVYQKHFTKGDVTRLIAFYSSPTGQKYLRESPAIAAEASAMPILQKHMTAMNGKVEEEIAQMKKGPNKAAQAQPNR